MISIEDILTKYWSQLTLVLLGIGYLLKRILDLRTKKYEINHSLFQQKRLETVNTFFSSYAKTEAMWTSIAIWDILKHKITAKELDQIVFPHINELKRNILELQIYLSSDDHKLFTQIMDNVYEINRKLSSVYFDYNPDKNVISQSNGFQSFRDKKLKENETIFKQISENLKRTFQ